MPSSDRAPDSDAWSRTERGAPARATSGADPGRRALTDGLRAGAVQREPASSRPVAAPRSMTDAADGADVARGADVAPVPGGLGDTGDAALVGTGGDRHWHRTAAAGVTGAGGGLPFAGPIQAAFGDHGVGDVVAHVGGAASAACDQLGAAAYATGDRVAFRGPPSLHTAAHEAAHVIQQRAGVSLADGLGSDGDRYEQHADAVADAVVRGEPAAPLLDALGGGSSGGPARAVQRQDRAAGPGPADGAAPGASSSPGALCPTDEAVAECDLVVIEARLRGLGIDAEQIGDLQSLIGWRRSRLERAWTLLDDLDHGRAEARRDGRPGSRGRRGAEHRPVRAWNVELDDLGRPGTGNPGGRYRNILEYVDNLDHVARDSMDMPYEQAMAAMPTVRLAGAPVGVHPRALFFAAAAQAEMDRLVGRQPGDGHYIPAGGFRRQLIDIAGVLESLARGTPPSRRARRDGATATPIPGGQAVFETLRAELVHIQRVLADQAANVDTVPGYHHDEHREPELRTHLAQQWPRIAAVPSPASDHDVLVAAGKLLTALGDIPGGPGRGHGAGSIDPHGTEHAMGLAVDLHHGRRWWQDFAPPDAYWPFIDEVIRSNAHRPEVAALGQPRSLGDIGSPQQGRMLAGLMQTQGRAVSDRLIATVPADPEQARTDRTESNRLTALRRRIRRGLQGRLSAVRRALRPGPLRRVPAALHDDLRAAATQLVADIDLIALASVDQLASIVAASDRRLDALERHLDRVGVPAAVIAADAADDGLDDSVVAGPDHGLGDGITTIAPPVTPPPRGPLDAVGPDDGPRQLRLDSLATAIGEVPDGIEAMVRRDQDSRLRDLVARPGFQRWLASIADRDHPMYDQPDVMVAGLESVEGSHFYGGHHWEIAPLPGTVRFDRPTGTTVADDSASILDRDGGSYRDMLDANMRPHGGETPDVARARIERTLVIMAESPGGRVALFGDGPEQRAAVLRDADPILHAALAQALGDEAALAQVLTRIEQTMVGDYAGMSGDQAAVMRQMRDLGFHDDAGAPPSTP